MLIRLLSESREVLEAFFKVIQSKVDGSTSITTEMIDEFQVIASQGCEKEALEYLKSALSPEEYSAAYEYFDEYEAISSPRAEAIPRDPNPPFFIIESSYEYIGEKTIDRDQWDLILSSSKDNIRGISPIVGRIEIAGSGNDSDGTGWLIKDNILITAKHVVEKFENNSVTVNFKAEHTSDSEANFKLKKIVGTTNDDLDLGFLEISQEGVDERGQSIRLPSSSIELADTATINAAQDSLQAVAVIGYPIRRIPRALLTLSGLTIREVDELFQEEYDVKRLMPGNLKLVDPSTRRVLLPHTCVTLPGASGGVLMDLETGKVLGLHVEGKSGRENFAVRADFIKAEFTNI